ncbi:hypothetical protein G6F50_018528 [Rhizopus delemar]|uniref:Uncharacterized protein n=1 Tax=Rhizopus delemar TaxID=936053 RepID=A0A9P7BZ22_9FUNG|nr:hypothetical protein G6F50_018528 [Rhizopus delemar]
MASRSPHPSSTESPAPLIMAICCAFSAVPRLRAVMYPGASISGIHRKADSTLASWKRLCAIPITPATVGMVERIGPRNRPISTDAKP